MMRPFPRAIMARPAAWLAKNVPFTFTATVRSKSSSRTSSAGFSGPSPALFTRMSSRPRLATVSSTARNTWSICVTSIWSRSARRPMPSIREATSPPTFASRMPSATSAPAFASASEIARPRPRAAPVTSATCPIRSNRGNSSMAAPFPIAGALLGRPRQLVRVLPHLRQGLDHVFDPLTPGPECVLHEVDRLAKAGLLGYWEAHRGGVEPAGVLNRHRQAGPGRIEQVVAVHRRVLDLGRDPLGLKRCGDRPVRRTRERVGIDGEDVVVEAPPGDPGIAGHDADSFNLRCQLLEIGSRRRAFFPLLRVLGPPAVDDRVGQAGQAVVVREERPALAGRQDLR